MQLPTASDINSSTLHPSIFAQTNGQAEWTSGIDLRHAITRLGSSARFPQVGLETTRCISYKVFDIRHSKTCNTHKCTLIWHVQFKIWTGSVTFEVNNHVSIDVWYWGWHFRGDGDVNYYLWCFIKKMSRDTLVGSEVEHRMRDLTNIHSGRKRGKGVLPRKRTWPASAPPPTTQPLPYHSRPPIATLGHPSPYSSIITIIHVHRYQNSSSLCVSVSLCAP